MVNGKNVINYLVFTHSHMYMLLGYLMVTFLGAFLLYGHTSPNRYALITINICSHSTYIGEKKMFYENDYLQLHANLHLPSINVKYL